MSIQNRKNKEIRSLPETLLMIFTYIVLIFMTFICLIPFVLMISNMTRSSSEIYKSVSLIPSSFLLDNYGKLQLNVNIWQGFRNSTFISVLGTICAAYIGSLAAYGFSRFSFKGKNLLFWIMLGSMMVPPQLGLIGYFDVVNKLGLYDNLLAVAFALFANSMLLFFVKLYIDSSIPKSIIESARLEGAGEFRIFNSIILPIIKPSIATMSIFVFISSWNNFLGPFIVLSDTMRKTLPILIAESKGMFSDALGAQYLAVGISVIPIIIIFILFSKHIISGLTSGAVKE